MIPEDKPTTLSVKDYIIRKMSVKMRMSENTIAEVVHHQFKYLNESLTDNNSVEVSGFGKFIFKTKWAEKELQRKREFLISLESKPETEKNIEKIILIKLRKM